MKISKIMLTLFILLAILTATAVSATQDVENMTAEAPLEEIESSDVDTVIQTDEEEQLEENTDLNYEVECPDVISPDFEDNEIAIWVEDTDATGNVTFSINDEPPIFEEDVSYFLWGGYVSLDDVEFINGENKISIAYTGDDNYNSFYEEYFVTYLDSIFDIIYDDSGNIKFMDDVKFSIRLLMDGTDPVTVTYGNRTYSVPVDRYGEGEITLTDFRVGKSNITFSYEDEYERLAVKNVTIETEPVITIENTYEYKSSEGFVFMLPEDATGNLKIYIGTYNESKEDYDWSLNDTVPFENGEVNYPLNWDVGRYHVRFAYDGDYYDQFIDDEYTISVVPAVLVPKKIHYGDSSQVIIILPEDGSENLFVEVYSYEFGLERRYSKTLFNGIANGTRTLDLDSDLELNQYFIGVEYGEMSFVKDFIVTDSPRDFDFIVDFPKIVHGDSTSYFKANVPHDADGVLTLFINDEIVGEWGEFDWEYMIPPFNPDSTNTWELKFTDDSYYNEYSVNGTFEYKMITIPENLDQGGFIPVSLEGFEGILVFSIDGKQIYNDIFSNFAMIPYKDLSVGTHSYEIVMYDASNQLVLDENGTFNVDYIITVYTRPAYPLVDVIEIPVKLPADATGKLVVSYMGTNSTYELINGSTTVILDNLEEGDEEIIFTYLGDENYPRKSVKDRISISDYEIVFHEEPGASWLSLILPADASGNLNVYTVDEDTYDRTLLASVALVGGNAKYALEPGNYIIYAEYDGDDYELDEFEDEVIVLPEAYISNRAILGENTSLEIFALNANGEFQIYVDDELLFEGKLDESGKKTINLSGLMNLGEHRITFWYNGTQLYDDYGEFEVKFTVWPGTITVPLQFGFDKSANMTLNLTEYARGNLSVYSMSYIGPEYIFVQNLSVSGNAIVPLTAERSGVYFLSIEYVDEKYGEFSTQTQVYVPRPDAGADVVIPETVTSDTLEIAIPSDSTGPILAIIDGKSQILQRVGEYGVIDLSAVPKGPHNITIRYRGDENYEGFEKTAVFAVKYASSVTIEPISDVGYGNRVDIEYKIENRSSNVTFSIRHADSDLQPKVTGIEVDFNTTTVLINGLAVGKYVIYVSDNGDENHTGDTAHAFFNVVKAVPTLDVTVKVNEYGIISIEAVLGGNATGNVTFAVINESGDAVVVNTEDIVNGVATFAELAKYAKGNYNYVVTYNGDSNYGFVIGIGKDPVVISKEYISPKNTQLDVEGGEFNITVDLGVNATGKVHVVYPSGYVDNVTIKDGKVNFYDVFMNETGPITLVLDYDGDDNYYGFFEYFIDFTIKKATFVTAKPISVVYKNNAKWTINLKDADLKPVSGQTIKVTVNGKTYAGKTDAKGNAVVIIPANMLPKAYTAKIVYAGTAVLEDDFDNVKFTVKKATPKLTAKKKTFKAKTKVKKYKVVLKDHKKKAMKKVKVTLKVKGKKYTSKTNKKGKAVFKIKNLKKKGTYKAKVSVKATKYFNKVTKKVKIKVKK